MPAEIESDPMFTLLTDALRAGPASPAWQDAVARLRESGAAEGDEYRLLVAAREDLERGKDYRSVRAGAGFTRKLMERIETDEQPARRFSTANLIALLCGVAIVAALGVLAYRIASPPAEPDRQAIAQLAAESTAFLNPIASAEFATDQLPQGWKQIGSLPLGFANGVSPSAGSATSGGGGVYLLQSIAADRPFTFEVMANVEKSSDNITLEAFVANNSNFSADRSTSAGELDWLLHSKEQQVVVEGHVKLSTAAATGRFPVRITVGKEIGIVEVGERAADGKLAFRRVWAGAHHLGDGPRYVGVRFLETAADPTASLRVEQVKVVSR